jgi:hypothetical protein
MKGFEQEEPPEQTDARVESAKPDIVETLKAIGVATDRELKVRLEKKYFPWVVGRALGILLEQGDAIKVGYAGRRRVRGSEVASFYTLKGVQYATVEALIKEKKIASEAVANILTEVSLAADHAEELFEPAFRRLGFIIHGKNMSEFRGKKAVGVPDKEPPNVDFVIERDAFVYGVDVKNWIRYEWDTRRDVVAKVTVARQMGVVPFIVARYLDQDVLYNEIYLKSGLAYRYGELLVPVVYESVAKTAKALLGYP